MAPDLKPFAGMNWISQIPTTEQIAELAGRVNMGVGFAANGVELARVGIGKAWESWEAREGVPAASPAQLEEFGKYLELVRDTPPATSAAFRQTAELALNCTDGLQCSGQVLKGALGSMQSTLMASGVLQSVPALGYVVQFAAFAVNVGKVIWKEAQGADKPGSLPLTLNRESDESEAQGIVNGLRAPDWTDLWLPEYDATGSSYLNHQDVDYPDGGRGGRVYIGAQNGGTGNLGQGLLPGESNVARTWQYRGTQASKSGSTLLDRLLAKFGSRGKGTPHHTMYGMDYFRPSMGQASLLFWQHLQNGGPDLFRVDTARLDRYWHAYWGAWEAAYSQMAFDGNVDAMLMVQQMLFWGGIWANSPFQDWPGAGAEIVEKVPERYRTLLAIDYQGNPAGGLSWYLTRRGITLRMVDNLRARQSGALDRLDVAYLTGKEPALVGELKLKFNARRQQLLTDPALAAVDFDRVPQSEWRKEAVKRRLGLIQQKIAFAEVPLPPALLPVMPWGQGNIGGASGVRGPGGSGTRAPTEAGGAGGNELAIVAGLAAAAYLLGRR